MAFLFEYGEWATIPHAEDLRHMLEAIWSERVFTEELPDNETNSYQPFFQFDGNKIRARNYSGFIQRDGDLIEIYPKVFRDNNCQERALMLNHIFYWLGYCRKWTFPFTKAGLDLKETENFPELIINLIANQIHSTVTSNPLAQYQLVEEALLTPKGSINFNRYVTNSLSKSNFHLLECDYEPFSFDNNVNRVIKYCSRLLLNKTFLSENIRILQEVIYTLDEVTDVACTLRDAELISLNSFYENYQDVLDSCKLILAQQLYSGKPYDLSQWCLLLPMEYIFEDFIAGFLETHFNDQWKVEYQKSDLYLSDKPRAFNLQQDIFMTNKRDSDKTLIVDAKYKIREKNFSEDPKKGISQSDLYQMVSYAYKRGCHEVVLLYPNLSETLNETNFFEINSRFDSNLKIKIKAMEVPFWSAEGVTGVDHALKRVLTDIDIIP